MTLESLSKEAQRGEHNTEDEQVVQEKDLEEQNMCQSCPIYN